MDKYDKKILLLLQEDASISAAEIGDRVGLSQSQCWRRIERLETDGIIRKRVALVDRKKIALNVVLFAHVKLAGHGRGMIPEFAAAIQNFPEVMECHLILGSIDFLLRIVVRDMDAYERFLVQHLSRLPMIQEINSMVALSEMKFSTVLPVE